MNNKWYISALIIILALFGGIASNEQNIIPNQEIVLQFTSETVSNDEAQNVIAVVKQQLHSFGVEDIQVATFKDGQLKITYFSTIDIGSVKRILSKQKAFDLSDSSINGSDIPLEIPSKENTIDYNLDVYEIQNGYDTALHLSGKLGIEHKADNDRLSITNPYATSKAFDYSDLVQKLKVAYLFHNYSGFTTDHKSNKIPEVRAGPNRNGMIFYL